MERDGAPPGMRSRGMPMGQGEEEATRVSPTWQAVPPDEEDVQPLAGAAAASSATPARRSPRRRCGSSGRASAARALPSLVSGVSMTSSRKDDPSVAASATMGDTRSPTGRSASIAPQRTTWRGKTSAVASTRRAKAAADAPSWGWKSAKALSGRAFTKPSTPASLRERGDLLRAFLLEARPAIGEQVGRARGHGRGLRPRRGRRGTGRRSSPWSPRPPPPAARP